MCVASAIATPKEIWSRISCHGINNAELMRDRLTLLILTSHKLRSKTSMTSGILSHRDYDRNDFKPLSSSVEVELLLRKLKQTAAS